MILYFVLMFIYLLALWNKMARYYSLRIVAIVLLLFIDEIEMNYGRHQVKSYNTSIFRHI